MDLFYTPAHTIDLQRGELFVDGEEFFHIAKVLRKKEGETVYLTDGNGLSVEAVITKIGKGKLSAGIKSAGKVPQAATSVTVALSLLKSQQRFDFFLEKATELGISRVVPMITARTVAQVKAGKIESKLARWRSVLRSASLQAKRYYFPMIGTPLGFDDVLCLDGYDMKLIPYELSKNAAHASFAGKKVLFVIGGEGGFTNDEVAMARAQGCSDISFGNSILRAETAGVFAVAMVRSQIIMHGDRAV